MDLALIKQVMRVSVTYDRSTIWLRKLTSSSFSVWKDETLDLDFKDYFQCWFLEYLSSNQLLFVKPVLWDLDFLMSPVWAQHNFSGCQMCSMLVSCGHLHCSISGCNRRRYIFHSSVRLFVLFLWMCHSSGTARGSSFRCATNIHVDLRSKVKVSAAF